MIILGLGSNVGEKLDNLKLAIEKIGQIAEIKTISNIYQSDALVPEGAPDSWNTTFFNMAVLIKTELNPKILLSKIKQVEQEIGRKKNYEKWSPRIIDIDVLCYGDKVIETEEITVPHPHLCARPFAIWPLAEIAKNWLHPVYKKSAFELAKKFGNFPACTKEKGNLYNTIVTREKIK